MKLLLLISLMLITTNVMPFNLKDKVCINVSEKYDVKYQYKNNILTYKIFPLNKVKFKYYKKEIKEMPSELTMTFTTALKDKYDNQRKLYDNVYLKHYHFNEDIYSVNLLIPLSNLPSYPLPNKDFEIVESINKEISIDKYINTLEGIIPNQRKGTQSIKFKLSIILDENINECININMNEIIYNIKEEDSKEENLYWKNIKSIFDLLRV